MDQKRIDKALAENIRLGFMEIAGTNADGEELFRLTKKGKERVDAIMKENPRFLMEMGLDDGLH